MTRVNEASGNIHKKLFNGGSNTLEISSNVEFILEELEYYDITNKIFGGRHNVIINEEWDSVIQVYDSRNKSFVQTIGIFGLGIDPNMGSSKNYKYLLIKY